MQAINAESMCSDGRMRTYEVRDVVFDCVAEGKVVVAAGEKAVLHRRFLGTSYYRSTGRHGDRSPYCCYMCVYTYFWILQQVGCFIDEELHLPYAIEDRKARPLPRQERCETALSRYSTMHYYCTALSNTCSVVSDVHCISPILSSPSTRAPPIQS